MAFFWTRYTRHSVPGREGGDGLAVVILEGVVGELQTLLGPVGPQIPGSSIVVNSALFCGQFS